MPEINDYKYSNKKLYELSQNQGKREVFEKLYPGFIYTGHEVVFNDVDGGIYVSIKMRRLDMGNGRRYDQEYKDMIVDLFKVGMSLVEISSEYGIAKSTINGWIKDVKEIKVDENEVMTLKEVKALKKEMARIKEENEILHQRRALAKKAMAIFATRN